MQHHINTVDLVQVLFHRPDKAGLDVVKGVTLDDAGGSGHRVDCGDHLDARLCKNIADVHLVHTFLAKCDVIGRDLILRGIFSLDSVINSPINTFIFIYLIINSSPCPNFSRAGTTRLIYFTFFLASLLRKKRVAIKEVTMVAAATMTAMIT